ncbi:hypothetical protein GCM10029978_005830 [Actinoallomurus acanthiterrae]
MSETGEHRTHEPDRGPGAHSGHESLPQQRVIPGMASASEGYAADAKGTGQGDPLSGVELRPDEASREAGPGDAPAPETARDGTPLPKD